MKNTEPCIWKNVSLENMITILKPCDTKMEIGYPFVLISYGNCLSATFPNKFSMNTCQYNRITFTFLSFY